MLSENVTYQKIPVFAGKDVRFLIQKLMNWRYSGFSVYAGNRIGRDDKADNECAVVRNQDDPQHYFGIVLLE